MNNSTQQQSGRSHPKLANASQLSLDRLHYTCPAVLFHIQPGKAARSSIFILQQLSKTRSKLFLAVHCALIFKCRNLKLTCCACIEFDSAQNMFYVPILLLVLHNLLFKRIKSFNVNLCPISKVTSSA